MELRTGTGAAVERRIPFGPVAVALAALVGSRSGLTLANARVHAAGTRVVAVARAAVQLTAVALLIAWVFAHPGGPRCTWR